MCKDQQQVNPSAQPSTEPSTHQRSHELIDISFGNAGELSFGNAGESFESEWKC
jgi:hypothetical protein